MVMPMECRMDREVKFTVLVGISFPVYWYWFTSEDVQFFGPREADF